MIKKFAYNYPAWHKSPYREGFSEWSLIHNQEERFEGHSIIRPKIMYDDTSVEENMKQVKLAKEIGLDGFVMCYYFDGKKEVLNESLNLGFLPAIQKENFLFTFLVSSRLPRNKLPLDLYEDDSKERKKREVVFSEENLINLLDTVLVKYAKNNNFYKINGKPVLFLFQYYSFFENSGLTVSRILEIKRNLAKKHGFENLYFVGTVDYEDKILKLDYIDSYTSYNNLPNYNFGAPIQEYKNLVNLQIDKWVQYSNILNNNYSPSVSLGFDASSRGKFGKSIPQSLDGGRHYPWFPIVNGFDLELFGKNIVDAYKMATKNKVDFLMFCAWNEWTEGCVILEDTIFGRKKQEIIKNALSYCIKK